MQEKALLAQFEAQRRPLKIEQEKSRKNTNMAKAAIKTKAVDDDANGDDDDDDDQRQNDNNNNVVVDPNERFEDEVDFARKTARFATMIDFALRNNGKIVFFHWRWHFQQIAGVPDFRGLFEFSIDFQFYFDSY